jgi:hypothetical protein
VWEGGRTLSEGHPQEKPAARAPVPRSRRPPD